MMDSRETVKAIGLELEKKGAYAFFDCEEENYHDIFDIEYTLNSDFDLIGVTVAIAIGGPHISIDTRSGTVALQHGAQEAYWYLSAEARDDVAEYFCEIYEMRREA